MKKFDLRLGIIATIVIFLLLAAGSFALFHLFGTGTKTAVFHDAAVEAEIRRILKKETGAINAAEIETLKKLDLLEFDGRCKDVQDIATYFPGLKHLTIDNFTGDGDICRGLGGLKQLESFRLTSHGESLDIEGLAGQTELTTLYLNAGVIKAENKSIWMNLKHLKTVVLENVQQVDLSFITKLPCVQQVELINCSLSDVSPLTDMQGLRKLAISYDEKATPPMEFASMEGIKNKKNLKYISLGTKEVLTGYLYVRSDDKAFEIFTKSIPQSDPFDYRHGESMTILVGSGDADFSPLQVLSNTTESVGAPAYSAELGGIFYPVDVNFDAQPDILILNGYYGNQVYASYSCWLWNDTAKAFVENPSFREIQNASIDAVNHTVLGCWRNSAGSHSYAMYQFQKGRFVMTSMLTEEVLNDDTLKEGQIRWQFTDERLIDGKMQICDKFSEVSQGDHGEESAKFYKAGSYWDLY